MKSLEAYLFQGVESPYDAPDIFLRNFPEIPPPSAIDWAHAAARGVIKNLVFRKGMRDAFIGISQEVRHELVAEISEIIRLAQNSGNTFTTDSVAYKNWDARRNLLL
jgi:hypothetical protein